jgi:hypothetical protein
MKRSIPLLCALVFLVGASAEAAENCNRLPARAKQKCLERNQQTEPRVRTESSAARTNQRGGPAGPSQGQPSTAVDAAPRSGATPASAATAPSSTTLQAAPQSAAGTPVQPNAGASMRTGTSLPAASNTSVKAQAKPASARTLGRTTPPAAAPANQLPATPGNLNTIVPNQAVSPPVGIGR